MEIPTAHDVRGPTPPPWRPFETHLPSRAPTLFLTQAPPSVLRTALPHTGTTCSRREAVNTTLDRNIRHLLTLTHLRTTCNH